MIDDHLTPEEQAVTERLRGLPKRTLRVPARAAIHEQMMSEFRAQGDAGWTPVVYRSRSRVLFRTVGLIATVAVVVALLVEYANRQSAILPAATEVQLTVIQPLTVAPTSTPTLTPFPESTSTPVIQAIVPVTAQPFTPAPTETAPASVPTAASNSNIVTVEGPISSISGGHITVYSLDIEVAPQDPVLAVLAVGDIVHVEGSLAPDGAVIASTIDRFVNPPTSSDTQGAAAVSGRIEAINGSQVIVNGMPVRFAPDDPILLKIKVGDIVQIWGSVEGSGADSVLVPLHLTISNPVSTSNNPPTSGDEDTGKGNSGKGHRGKGG